MRTEESRPVRLQDYRPPSWRIAHVELDVSLDQTATRVRATLAIESAVGEPPSPLVLDGDDLSLAEIRIDGTPLPPEQYVATPDLLTIAQPPQQPFRLELETILDPSANTNLMGLYRSGAIYCTQCEAEGFRRISYFLDRPDVMAVYRTRIEAEKTEAPVLLANGNLVEAGDVPGTSRHFVVWHDPFPKPSYLFALVGGNLACVEDHFRTISGRDVALRVYVEPGKEPRCTYAMDALKRAMRWDETAFGREYDLDVFMIVAVSDFNMGAMENKGLNIFNDKYVLASPETATDLDFERIEAIIAHEYFHNWTGNRITCRDWFQLCLKEGLTVFRDQEFTADMRSRAVKRVSDVRVLRAHQFVEDAGPLAHPVRPALYREINNFYTPTVYEKGAEIVRMIRTLIGAQDFRRGMDLYFERHDGEAATVEQFVQCFADVSGVDFKQFMLWYAQAGTPEVIANGSYDPGTRSYRLDVVQSLPATSGQPSKSPMVIPLAVGLLDRNGNDAPLTLQDGTPVLRGVLTIREPAETFTFRDVNAQPIPSLNRGFSAPIKLVANLSPEQLRMLAARDNDPFNRWQAMQSLATRLLVENTAAHSSGGTAAHPEGLLEAMASVVADGSLEPAFMALMLALPSEADIAREIGRGIDPEAIFAARSALRASIGGHLAGPLFDHYRRLSEPVPYNPDAAGAGRRALRNTCLDLLVATGRSDAIALAARQYTDADNMTDRMAGLSALSLHDVPERTAALDDFYVRYAGDPLIIDKWFTVQATIPEASTLDLVKKLTRHSAFSFANPNRVRALIGSFALGNQREFNRVDGAGYDFVVDTVLVLDPKNPQVAARLLGALKSWRVLEAGRRVQAEAALRRVQTAKALSPDVKDIVERALAGTP
ncbi:MAG: aminopeptidase N [Xanthobacteraceae bacterium]